MKIFNSLDDFNLECDTAVTIGKFDGLHRGHKILCENLFVLEKKEGLTSLAISFVDPPISIVHGVNEKKIVTNEERRSLIRDAGISVFVEIPFDEQIMKTEPGDFIKLLVEKLNMKYLIRAVNLEYEKAGRLVDKAIYGQYAVLLIDD